MKEKNLFFNVISDSNMSTISPDSMLFTLRSFQGSESPHVITTKDGEEGIIYNSIKNGPAFGVDLLLTGQNGTSSLGNTYNRHDLEPKEAYLAGSSEFVLSELEVYYSGTCYSCVQKFIKDIINNNNNNNNNNNDDDDDDDDDDDMIMMIIMIIKIMFTW